MLLLASGEYTAEW